MPIEDFQNEHIDAITKIHCQSLAGNFLPSLGAGFLRSFYRIALKTDNFFGFVSLESGRPVGFICTCLNTHALFRSVMSRGVWHLSYHAAQALLKCPALIRNMIDTLFYPARESTITEQAELLVIAVDVEYRGKGIGTHLVQKIDDAFLARGVISYKVAVIGTNDGANNFYKRLGFVHKGSFYQYQQLWNIYLRTLKDITHEPIYHSTHVLRTG